MISTRNGFDWAGTTNSAAYAIPRGTTSAILKLYRAPLHITSPKRPLPPVNDTLLQSTMCLWDVAVRMTTRHRSVSPSSTSSQDVVVRLVTDPQLPSPPVGFSIPVYLVLLTSSNRGNRYWKRGRRGWQTAW